MSPDAPMFFGIPTTVGATIGIPTTRRGIGVVATEPASCILPSDIETLRAGYISVTPLRTNLTDYQLLAYLPKHIAYL